MGDQVTGDDLDQAISSMASCDPVAAQRLLDMLKAKQAARGNYQPIDAEPVIKALGNKDPAAALALAKMQPDHLRPAALLEAAAYQPKSTAKNLLQEVFADDNNITIMNLAKANAVAPDYAREIYVKHRNKLEEESYHFSNRFTPENSTTGSRVQYAYLISSIDPVEARLILETEFAETSSKDQHAIELMYFPQAMCPLDLARAQVMIKAINSKDHDLQQFFHQRIMQYILMPRADRVASTFF